MSVNKVYLITGASRGIGAYILGLLLNRPNTTVLAAGRSDAALESFARLPHDPSSKCIPLCIDSTSDTDVPNAVSELREKGIVSIDVVIANAGFVSSMKSIKDTTVKEIIDHVDVNCNGVMRLIHGLWKVIGGDDDELANGKIFAVISSSVGSIAAMEPVPGLAYGLSKAAANFLTRKMHDEWKGCAVAIHPGWVKTEMGNFAAEAWGVPEAPMEVGESGEAVLKLIDGLNREKDGGKFLSYDSNELPW